MAKKRKKVAKKAPAKADRGSRARAQRRDRDSRGRLLPGHSLQPSVTQRRRGLPPEGSGWDPRAVEQLARLGADSHAIAEYLGLHRLLGEDSEKRREFQRLVSRGLARHAVETAEALYEAGIRKRRSGALMRVAEAYLDRYRRNAAEAIDEQGLVDRVMGELEKLNEARIRNGATPCPTCGTLREKEA